MINDLYRDYFSEGKLWVKLKKIGIRIGSGVVRQILILFVLLTDEKVPVMEKLSIIAVLGYLICPIDLIPDFLPGGLADDLAAIALLLAGLSIYQTPEVESQVKSMLKDIGMGE